MQTGFEGHSATWKTDDKNNISLTLLQWALQKLCYLPKSGGRLVRDISFRPSTVRLRSCTNPGGNLQTSTYYTCMYPLVWRMWLNVTVKWIALLLWFSKFSVQISAQRQTTLEVFLWDKQVGNKLMLGQYCCLPILTNLLFTNHLISQLWPELEQHH